MTRDEQWLMEEKHGGKKTPEYEADKKRLARGEPLGYIIGWQPFLGLKIYLDSKSLIPRTETEWWAEQLITHVGRMTSYMRFDVPTSELAEPKMRAASGTTKRRLATRSAPIFSSASEHQLRFLDLCAGSGAIGCAALATLLDAQIYFGEIDLVHEATILKNIRENGLDNLRADIRIGDLFEPFGDMKFDIIAANPPYIPASRVLPASVALYEPSCALYSGEDGLDIIRRIAMELPKRLRKDGTAWIECDSAHAAAACALFETQGFSTKIRTDQYDAPRFLVISFVY